MQLSCCCCPHHHACATLACCFTCPHHAPTLLPPQASGQRHLAPRRDTTAAARAVLGHGRRRGHLPMGHIQGARCLLQHAQLIMENSHRRGVRCSMCSPGCSTCGANQSRLSMLSTKAAHLCFLTPPHAPTPPHADRASATWASVTCCRSWRPLSSTAPSPTPATCVGDHGHDVVMTCLG